MESQNLASFDFISPRTRVVMKWGLVIQAVFVVVEIALFFAVKDSTKLLVVTIINLIGLASITGYFSLIYKRSPQVIQKKELATELSRIDTDWTFDKICVKGETAYNCSL